jgi:hypothetical protein
MLEDPNVVIRSGESKKSKHLVAKWKRTNSDTIYTEYKWLSNTNLTENRRGTHVLQTVGSSCSISGTRCATAVKTRWYVMNEDRAELRLRQKEHWEHSYSVSDNQVMIISVTFSRWYRDMNYGINWEVYTPYEQWYQLRGIYSIWTMVST